MIGNGEGVCFWLIGQLDHFSEPWLYEFVHKCKRNSLLFSLVSRINMILSLADVSVALKANIQGFGSVNSSSPTVLSTPRGLMEAKAEFSVRPAER